MPKKVTGLEFRLRRVAARATQWDVAQMVGISQSQLSLIENERIEAPAELAVQILGAIQELAGEGNYEGPNPTSLDPTTI